MSIYRDNRRAPTNDIFVVAKQETPRYTIAAPSVGAFELGRKANPIEVLLNNAAAWVRRLPLDVRPLTLCGRFPRIANALCSVWPDPERTHAYFDELLLDHRGDRQGFPTDVLRELLTLQAWYQIEHPHVADAWHQAS